METSPNMMWAIFLQNGVQSEGSGYIYEDDGVSLSYESNKGILVQNVMYTFSGGVLKLQIAGAEGSIKGARKHSVQLRGLPLTLTPISVECNHANLSGWNRSTLDTLVNPVQSITIPLGSHKFEDSITVQIKFIDNSLVEAEA